MALNVSGYCIHAALQPEGKGDKKGLHFISLHLNWNYKRDAFGTNEECSRGSGP